MKQTNNLAIMALFGLLMMSSAAYATDDHADHQESDNAHMHEDTTHDAHEAEDSHDDHHEKGHHDDDEDNHSDEHGEDTTEIHPNAATQAGIVTKLVQAGSVAETITLTGRIILNRDTTVTVRGRFPGVVKSVHVNLGEKVKKGQLLAKVESNESLQVYKITSPTNGVILERNTSAGDVADEGTLFKIADLSNVWAEFHIFPKDVEDIREELPLRVHTLGDKHESQAKINLMSPVADRLSQTVLAIAVLPNPEGIWRPGMSVEGDVTIRQKQATVVVASSALQTLEGRQVVFIQEGNNYEARPVEIGLRGTDKVEILSGVEAGESYVAEGSFIIKADIGKESAEHSH